MGMSRSQHHLRAGDACGDLDAGADIADEVRIKGQQVTTHQRQLAAVIVQYQGARIEGIAYAGRGIVTGDIAGEVEVGRRGDLDSRRAGAEVGRHGVLLAYALLILCAGERCSVRLLVGVSQNKRHPDGVGALSLAHALAPVRMCGKDAAPTRLSLIFLTS